MPTTKTAPKTTKPATEPNETNDMGSDSIESPVAESAESTKQKREQRVQYAFAEGGDLEVADEIPEQVAIPRNTSGLVGRTSVYVGYLQRCKDEFPGKAVKIATFENGGAATVARNELLGLEVKNRKTGEMVKSKQRELPEGTTPDDWEVEVRRVMVTGEDGNQHRVSQLWVKYIGK